MKPPWPPIPKRLMAKVYDNHRRRQPASKGPYTLLRTGFDSVRVIDEETGAATEWQIKRHVAGVRLHCIADQPPADKAN